MELSGYIYRCSAGESFDSIAREQYQDEKYAAELLCVNPELAGKLVFEGGEQLYLPEIEIPETGDSEEETMEPDKAPWKE